MFCYQCQETAKNSGCTIRGTCGKDADLAALQDYLVYALKGLAAVAVPARALGISDPATDLFVAHALFATLTNVNFDRQRIYALTCEALARRDTLRTQLLACTPDPAALRLPAAATEPATGELDAFIQRGYQVGVQADTTTDADIRAMRELLTYGLKGLAAYTDHAYVLEHGDPTLLAFIQEGLAALTDDRRDLNDLIALAMRCGAYGVQVMALLDAASTSRFGHPVPTAVNIGVDPTRPGILVSGHDLLDLYEVLQQTVGTGINVYTHGELLPAHAYPAFKQFPHLIGNYGGAWWEQQREFSRFNGPIIVTTNCLQQPRPDYADRLFTTGMVGWDGIAHIADRELGQPKDFSAVIARARTCAPPTPLESGTVMVGFAHQTVLSQADVVLDAIQRGAIKRFVVMAGCDGRHKERAYYTEVARTLPADTIILTAGCAKYRYNKLNLGNIGGIPRVLDAGQCNDSYSLVKVALALRDAVGAASLNDLPISYDLAWYEQKAVLVLLSLLYLGVQGIRLGPTLPAFLSSNVADFLVRTFNLKPISTAEADVAAMLIGA